MKDGVGPRVPIANVTGVVERRGAAAEEVGVSIRDPITSAALENDKTDAAGVYRFEVGPGLWEVRVKGRVTGDFESVTRAFVQDSTAEWDGIGNEGFFAGTAVPTGAYTWRVKFELSDSSEARTPSWRVTVQ